MPSNGYDLAIIPALIGAISAIGAAGVGAAANNKNISQNQMNNDFNAREAQKARDFQLQMWNKQNEYNSPANQRKLRAEAGYNPYLGYDSNTGVAGSTGSTSQANAAPPLAVDPGVYSELGSQLGRAGQMIYQERESNARTKALQGEADVTRAQAMQVFSNIDWGKLPQTIRSGCVKLAYSVLNLIMILTNRIFKTCVGLICFKRQNEQICCSLPILSVL